VSEGQAINRHKASYQKCSTALMWPSMTLHPGSFFVVSLSTYSICLIVVIDVCACSFSQHTVSFSLCKNSQHL